MTTPKKLAYQIIRLLSNGTRPKDSNLNEDYIIAEVRQVAHAKIKGEFYQLKNEGENSISHLYIGTYSNVEVELDQDRERCYIDLPAVHMNLPGGLGIQEVRPQTGDIATDVAMIPILPNEIELFRSLNVGSEIFKDQWCFEPSRDKIWFTECDNETLLEAGIEEVEVKLVVLDPAQIGDNDTLPVPPEMEMDIIKDVLLLHGYNPQQAADLINNNNHNG